jgi:hypothetical protein
LGRRIQIRREKKFRITAWASIGLAISIFLTISSVLAQRVAQGIFYYRI